MQVRMSNYLVNIRPKMQELIFYLKNEFDYVSVLCTDVSGTSYSVGQRQTNVSDYHFGERGFVVRVYKNNLYLEYSFNDFDNIKDLAQKITDELLNELNALEALNLEKMESPLIHEDKMAKEMYGQIGIDPNSVSSEIILEKLKDISDKGAKNPGIIEFMARMSFACVNKMFISIHKDLTQCYAFCEGMVGALGTNGENTNMSYQSFSGLKGLEVLDEMEGSISKVISDLNDLLNAKPVVPGMYDVVVAPEVAGLIAHEAFGHGVEMDMFVKERALAKDYINEYVASPITSMKDGALSASQVSSYLFDDEGTLGTDTTIIDNGILKTGISDLLSALRLNTSPTGNGKRESFERKAYARMTNTLFVPGNDSVEDMIASIEDGYLLEGMQSGMEDPKHWGIQCVIALGREIKNGKLTGNIIAPVTLTGYVPDLLKSISMVSSDLEMYGSGACGKGHKEWVKTSDGGPYLKCKVRLG